MSSPTTPETKIWDGSNIAAVKPANTSAGVTDSALVVAISPNSRTVEGAGTAGTPSGGVLSIQGTVGGTALPVSGSTSQTAATTSTVSQVASSATTVTVLALNANRQGAIVYNDSTQVLYLKLGTTASPTSYTTQLSPGAYYEVPARYTGRIDGIWASANGNAYVTELTP